MYTKFPLVSLDVINILYNFRMSRGKYKMKRDGFLRTICLVLFHIQCTKNFLSFQHYYFVHNHYMDISNVEFISNT